MGDVYITQQVRIHTHQSIQPARLEEFMTLTNTQIEKALETWRDYIANCESFRNANKEMTPAEIDEERLKTIPEIVSLIERYIDGEVGLEEFKSATDSVNKRHRLWGFQGINGQMFFNMLTKTSLQNNCMDEFDVELKKAIIAPVNISTAERIINQFEKFTRKLGNFYQDRRVAPKIGSIPFFLSYFWQAQKIDTFPIYYTSLVNELSDLDIWKPLTDVSKSYVSFYHLSHELMSLYSKEAGRNVSLWDVEHAYWFRSQTNLQPEKEVIEKPVVIGKTPQVTITDDLSSLPESYIPPVVSILPKLSVNDPAITKLCEKAGRSVEKVFEERLAILFRMLGFEVDLKGQGYGRNPDGVALSHEFRYGIIFDAKVRQGGYSMGIDERAIREYIASTGDKLRRQGYRNIYFMLISSSFIGDHDSVIRSLKIDTDVREILLVEVSALLVLLEAKFRNLN
jgi:hypothetical protein